MDVEDLFDKETLVPSKIEINSTSDWFHRRKYSDRKAQLRVHPFSSDGHIHISFTKPVDIPENALDLVSNQNLVNVTFFPSTYDVEDSSNHTEIKEWTIEKISSYGMDLKVVFENPNLLGHSIFESDEVYIHVNLTSFSSDGSTDELFGRYKKALPL